MKTFSVATMIVVFLLSQSIGMQAQNKPTLESAINPRMDVKHLQNNPIPEMAGTQLLDSVITEYWDTITNQWKYYDYNWQKYNYDVNGYMIFCKPSLWEENEYAYDDKGNMTFSRSIHRSWMAKFPSKIECNYDANGHITLEIHFYVTSFTYDPLTYQWIKDTKYEHTYDANGNQNLSLLYRWDSLTNNWDAIDKTERTYDLNGNITLYDYFNWDESNNQWIIISKSKSEFTYDINRNLTLNIGFSWGRTTSQWIENNKYEYTYDAKGNQILYIENGNRKLESTYDENGNKTMEIYCYRNINTNQQWVNSYKNEYAYDANGNLTAFIPYGWRDNMWVGQNGDKFEYTYDDKGNKTSESISIWDETNNQWKISKKSKSEYTYDINGNLIFSIPYKWDETSSQWVCYSNFTQCLGSVCLYDFIGRIERTYNSNGNKTMEIYYNWDTTTSQWIPYVKISSYYSDHDITDIPQTPKSQLIVYPNPVKEFIVFDLSTSRESAVLLIYDIQGKKVIEQRLNESQQVSVNHLTKGLYLYRLDDGGVIYTGKVIKE